MAILSFKNWILAETKDIFGFERPQDQVHHPTPPQSDADKKKFYHPINPDLPIKRLDIEYLTYRLSKLKVNDKRPYLEFVNQIHWGKGLGSIRAKIHPDLHIEIARLSYDFDGEPTWATKKNFVINRQGYGGNEEFIAQELLQQLESLDKLPIDSPKKEYDLEKLTFAIADKIKQVGREYFLWEGITKLADNKYIISFSVKGQGVEAPGQRRIIENQTLLYFDKDAGKIRLTNKNIETSVGGHAWEIMPSDTDVNFFPTQPRDEIVNLMATTMRWY